MSNIVDEIWVMNEKGETVFNQCVEKTYDNSLFGSFISAFNQFANQISHEKCGFITLGDWKLSLRHNQDVIIVARSHKSVNDSKISNYMDKMSIRLFEKLGYEISEGTITNFKNGKIEEIIDIKNDKDNFLGIKLTKEKSKKLIDLL